MSKKQAKTKPAEPSGEGADATAQSPKKRSKLKLGLLVLLPLLVLGGGGYAGWTFYVGPTWFAEPHAVAAEDAHGDEQSGHAEGEGDGHAAVEGHEADPVEVSALPLDVLAETSATHTYALSVLMAERCGGQDVPELKAASEHEAKESGLLVQASWEAAVRRTTGLTDRNCDYLFSEVQNAEAKRANPAPAAAAPAH